MKYGSVTLGQVEAVWNRLGGENGVRRFLTGELVVSEPSRRWTEKDGIIYFSVISDGTTGPEWIARLEKKRFRLSENYAKWVLCSSDFRPTFGVTTEVALVKGSLFSDSDRVTSKIRDFAAAEPRNFTTPNPEVACLIREKFSDEEIEKMGLMWIITMHEPINDSGGDPGLIGAYRDVGGRWLGACWGAPGRRWDRDDGFAFAVSQVCSRD